MKVYNDFTETNSDVIGEKRSPDINKENMMRMLLKLHFKTLQPQALRLDKFIISKLPNLKYP